MEHSSTMPQAVAIVQDEQTELRVQAVVQSGRRQLDIRIWRRGPAGLAPSRNALTLEAGDLDDLQSGIQQLLQASNGGQQAARVVWDNEEGRRLRAETEPFGTRYLVKLVFWQRVRDTWRPLDDGLVLAADRLVALQEAVAPFGPWLQQPAADAEPDGESMRRHAAQGWPNPGADWLTVEPERLAFHPRGVRITATLEAAGDRHAISLHQWRRLETIWLPGACSLRLGMLELDRLLTCISSLSEARRRDEEYPRGTVRCGDGSSITASIDAAEAGPLLVIEHWPPGEDSELTADCRIALSAEYLPRVGRMLLQAGRILAAQLSRQEREELEKVEDDSPRMAAYDAPATPSPASAHATTRPAVGGTPAVRDVILSSLASAPPPPRKGRTAETPRVPTRPARRPEPERNQPPESPPQEEENEIPSDTIRLEAMDLGRHRVSLVQRAGEAGRIQVRWDQRALDIPTGQLEEVVGHLRTLYYDTLRGLRGRYVTVGEGPPVTVSVHNQGTDVFFSLAQELNDMTTSLSFPAGEVPVFLDAARAALAKLQRGSSE
jgi:hypothetical protein